MSTLNKPLNEQPQITGISRREFLYYLGGGSLALFTATICGVAYHYTARTLPLELQEGVFKVDKGMLPVGSLPVRIPEMGAWLFLQDEQLVVFSEKCTAWAGCIYKRVDVNNRFECPCSGSKYAFDGTYIDGPTPRSLDQFVLHFRTSDGIRQTSSAGGPVSIENATQIFVDTNRIILGAPRRR
jgi:cytochrome b6-f complex iron-sulfur subunit